MLSFKTSLLVSASVLFAACQTSTGNPPVKKTEAAKITAKENMGNDGPLTADPAILKKHIEQLKLYAKANGYSDKYAMLIDLGIHSGSKRFFVVQLSNEKTVLSGLVTHGSSPSVLKPGERAYSNVTGSLCSSLGRYKIGVSYQGTFGLAYKLHGLDTSNNHAFERAVVLHSHSCVPDTETSEGICQSWGCPTISPAFLQSISPIIDKSARPLLLEIYDSHK